MHQRVYASNWLKLMNPDNLLLFLHVHCSCNQLYHRIEMVTMKNICIELAISETLYGQFGSRRLVNNNHHNNNNNNHMWRIMNVKRLRAKQGKLEAGVWIAQ